MLGSPRSRPSSPPRQLEHRHARPGDPRRPRAATTSLRRQRAELRSPARLSAAASDLGMIPATSSEFMSIDPDVVAAVQHEHRRGRSTPSTPSATPALDEFGRAVKSVGGFGTVTTTSRPPRPRAGRAGRASTTAPRRRTEHARTAAAPRRTRRRTDVRDAPAAARRAARPTAAGRPRRRRGPAAARRGHARPPGERSTPADAGARRATRRCPPADPAASPAQRQRAGARGATAGRCSAAPYARSADSPSSSGRASAAAGCAPVRRRAPSCFGIVLGRIVVLQTAAAPTSCDAGRQGAAHQRDRRCRPERGTIFDRNGDELALSVPATTIFANPKLVADPRGTAADAGAAARPAPTRRRSSRCSRRSPTRRRPSSTSPARSTTTLAATVLALKLAGHRRRSPRTSGCCRAATSASASSGAPTPTASAPPAWRAVRRAAHRHRRRAGPRARQRGPSIPGERHDDHRGRSPATTSC